MRRILHPISVRQDLALQLNRFFKKGFQIYVVQILSPTENKGPILEDYKLFQEYVDVLPKEVPRLPLKLDIDFTTNLVPEESLLSKAPYILSTHKLVELIMQLQELMDKKYIRTSVPP